MARFEIARGRGAGWPLPNVMEHRVWLADAEERG